MTGDCGVLRRCPITGAGRQRAVPRPTCHMTTLIATISMLAALIGSVSRQIEVVDDQLTLDGLRIIYQRNVDER